MIRTALIYVLVVVGLLGFTSCAEDSNQGIVAEVNGYKITQREFNHYVAIQIPDISKPAMPDQARMLQLTLLRELIDRYIMLQRATKLGLVARDDQVDARLNVYHASYKTTDQFEQYRKKIDITTEELRNEFRRNILVEKLLAREIISKMVVSRKEIRDYYENNKVSFHLAEEQFHLAQILVTATPEVPIPNYRNDDAQDLEAARAKAEMLLSLLNEGQPFSEVARNYSEDPGSIGNGGDLGFIPQSFLEGTDLNLRRAVASLSPGEISPIIRSGSELRIIRLISRAPAGQREFSDPRIQQSIRETLKNRKDQLLRTAYSEMLRNKADVTNYIAKRIVSDFDSSN
jgi:peptidyl-prolyl cis-trans isomerase SurA